MYDRVACNFPSADLSTYVFHDLMAASIEGGSSSSSCTDTSILNAFCLLAITLTTILEDKTLEIEAVEMDAFARELDGVLTMDESNTRGNDVADARFEP